MKDTLVIGGGYAGILAANRLNRRTDIDITVVNPRPQFVERIRLHQLVAGNNDAVADYSTLLTDRAKLVVDSAERIDADAKELRLATGATLDYDYLVYAVGSTAPVPAAVPGARDFAYPLGELEAAQRLTARLADVPLQAPIVAVGGGLTGIEAASEWAEAGRNVTLVTGALGPSLAKGGRRSVARRLKKLGVTVRNNHAADTILARLDGNTPKNLNPASVGQCISLGRHAGTIQLSHFNDSALPMHIGGHLAASIKESVCKGTLSFLAKEARKPGSYFWPQGGQRQKNVKKGTSDV
ncbi:MAG: FAD-dependent oxidoreductase [Mycobacterium sp.]